MTDASTSNAPLTNCKKHRYMSHEDECPYCKEEAVQKAIEIAVDVIRKSSRGDQNFIECLRGDNPNTVALRHALVDLADALKET